MRQRAAEMLVLLAVRGDDGRRDVGDGIDERPGLPQLRRVELGADLVAVDVFPRASIREAQVAGADADDRAILVVQPLRIKSLDPTDMLDGPRDTGCAMEERTRDATQRVEVEVVNDGRNLV